MALSDKDARKLVNMLVDELFTTPRSMSAGALDLDPHLAPDEAKCRVAKWVQVVAHINAVNGTIVNTTKNSISPARAAVAGTLKVTDINVEDRYMGELLLEDDGVAVDGGAPSPGAIFNTRGYQYLFVTIRNPPWVTNPATLTVALHISTDAFDTEDFIVIARDGVAIVQTLQVADDIQQAFFMPVMSNVGVPAATAVPFAAPLPDIDDMTARLVFTPTGAGVTNETMTVNIYGITSR